MPRLLRACRMHVLISALGALHIASDSQCRSPETSSTDPPRASQGT